MDPDRGQRIRIQDPLTQGASVIWINNGSNLELIQGWGMNQETSGIQEIRWIDRRRVAYTDL